ncbi:hypothetical protein AW168_04125 [Nocardia brasiliensis]|uniref:Glycosyltransferase RgtA/B/C/D-like domain-containing protein n=1 Tax=Nocardia brasiliensis (strain ATCC 700358 / HUJEG-1) TaxID=1133849 RepID=K0EN63_NOCB7|nr:hypothetical protein O3I_015535 [Nocardia brasiliensis ATCC 700358]OCF84274.1 hypothetical protein AW168_04125 [Nocardia brasiliensis]
MAAIAGGTLVLGWRASKYGSWMVDDAGITFAYARSVAAGLGPVLQPGAPPVEGFSNPTWLFVLVVGSWCGLFDRGSIFGVPDYVLYPKAVALLCCAGILAACYLAARRVSRWPALVTFAAGVLLAAIPSFVIWCFSGLENSLFALAACALAVHLFLAVLDERLWTPKAAVLAGAIAAFAALTRPDGLIYLVAYPAISLLLVRRATWTAALRGVLYSGLAFALPFGAYLVWRYSEFGRLVANTAVAKNQEMPSVQDLSRIGDLVQYAGAPAVILAVGVVGLALASPGKWRDGAVALLVPLALAMVAYCVLEPDWMAQFRFATPVWALGALVFAISAGELLAKLHLYRRVLVVLALVGALIPSGVAFADASGSYRANSDVPLCWIVLRFGEVFNGYADILELDQGSLFTPDMGGSSLTSRLRLIDMAGLVEARIANIYAGEDHTDLSDYIFDEIEPTFVHTHGGWMGNQITVDPRIERDYYRIHRSPDPDRPDEDWVRKDVVRAENQLQQLRDYAGRVLPPLWPGFRASDSCGPALRPGQTPGS